MKKLTKIECSLTRGGKEHSPYYVVTVPSKNIIIHFNTHLDNGLNRFLIKMMDNKGKTSKVFTYYLEEPSRTIDAEHLWNKNYSPCTPKIYNTAHKILTEISKDFKTISLLKPDLKDVQLVLYIQF